MRPPWQSGWPKKPVNHLAVAAVSIVLMVMSERGSVKVWAMDKRLRDRKPEERVGEDRMLNGGRQLLNGLVLKSLARGVSSNVSIDRTDGELARGSKGIKMIHMVRAYIGLGSLVVLLQLVKVFWSL
jgi:hypothetical protein